MGGLKTPPSSANGWPPLRLLINHFDENDDRSVMAKRRISFLDFKIKIKTLQARDRDNQAKLCRRNCPIVMDYDRQYFYTLRTTVVSSTDTKVRANARGNYKRHDFVKETRRVSRLSMSNFKPSRSRSSFSDCNESLNNSDFIKTLRFREGSDFPGPERKKRTEADKWKNGGRRYDN